MATADPQGTAVFKKRFSEGSNYVWATCGDKQSLTWPLTVYENTPSPLPSPPQPPCAVDLVDGRCNQVDTAIGQVTTDVQGLITKIFAVLLSLSGGIALLLIVKSGYQMMVSRGNQEIVKAARETLTSALIGFAFLIFSLVILEFIGVDILRIPGLAR